VTPAENFATSSVGVIVTGGKFAAGVGTISDCLDIKVNLKEKIIYMLILLNKLNN
jgi:hypothetical protein